MKEDILEQLVDDYLMHQGYFTQHNIRYRPSKDDPGYDARTDSNRSDIDILALHPTKRGTAKVVTVTCKSWIRGFNPASKAREVLENRRVRLRFRELAIPKWSEAFRAIIRERTGSAKFEYWTAVTKLTNPEARKLWEENERFKKAIGGNPIRLLTLAEVLTDLWDAIEKTPAPSDIGRALRLMKFADWRPVEG